MRPVVEAFAHAMEYKLQRNDHKGGWAETPNRVLFDRLEDEVKELADALARGNYLEIMLEAADVANFALMLAHNNTMGALSDETADKRYSAGARREKVDNRSNPSNPKLGRAQLQRNGDSSRHSESILRQEGVEHWAGPLSGVDLVGIPESRPSGSDNGGHTDADQGTYEEEEFRFQHTNRGGIDPGD